MNRIGIMLLGLAPAFGAYAASTDALWEITTKMEIQGMADMPRGVSIPGMPGGASKQTVCLAEGKKYESEEEKKCKVLEQRKSGNKTMVRVQCKEGTMTIEHEQVSRDHWRSKVTMSGEQAGTITSEGRRVGSCDASKEGGMSRETQQVLDTQKGQTQAMAASLGKECLDAVANWPRTNPFGNYDILAKQRADAIVNMKGNMKVVDATFPDVPHCARAKTDYCAKSRAAGAEMGTRKGYVALVSRHGKSLEQALSYCGVPAVSVATHCKSAVGEADYAFVAAHCPAERKTLAATHCAGRSYTSVEKRYQPLCTGREFAGGGGREYTAQQGASGGAMDRLKGLFGGGSPGDRGEEAAAGSGATAQPAESGADTAAAKEQQGVPVGEGVRQLKKIFGF